MNKQFSRRQMLGLAGRAAVLAATLPGFAFGKNQNSPLRGVLTGDDVAAGVAAKIFADGGNAIDAVVGGALAAGITSPSKCGIGGYGGAIMVARPGKKVTCIDFDSVAPAAARADMYPLDAKGNVIGKVNYHGWLAVGVPGTLAGLQLALQNFGTKSFGELVQPAISLGRKAPPNPHLKYDALVEVLSTLAGRNSVDSFYHGDIAQEVADGFKKNGGLVTTADLAAYRAREAKPYELEWNGINIYTAPLCAGGLSFLEALSILKALGWEKSTDSPEATHARLEALRLAWKDRAEFLGDPDFVKVPIKRLLSAPYAAELAAQVDEAVKARRPVPINMGHIQQTGTLHLSCADEQGNLAALTMTMGNSYGAQVTLDRLGVVLGHGMSRFDPQPGFPNSVAPGKRPLNNMCPSIASLDGRPVLAVGGAGGTKIINALFDFFSGYVGRRKTMAEAINLPRMNTTGSLDLGLEKNWPAAEAAYFKKIGYRIKTQTGAFVNGVTRDPATGLITGAHREGNSFQ